jgi:hypothetical protein
MMPYKGFECAVWRDCSKQADEAFKQTCKEQYTVVIAVASSWIQGSALAARCDAFAEPRRLA